MRTDRINPFWGILRKSGGKIDLSHNLSSKFMFKAFSVTCKHLPIVALLAIATLPIGAAIAQARDYHITLDQIPRTGRNMRLPDIEYNPAMLIDPNGANGAQVLSVISRDGKLGVAIKLRKTSANQKEPPIQVLFPGDRLTGGITLKRIEKRNTSMIAVLEEDGTEVIRYVGDL